MDSVAEPFTRRAIERCYFLSSFILLLASLTAPSFYLQVQLKRASRSESA